MKATLKNVAAALALLAMVMVVLVAVDKANGITVAANNTHIKITVVDLNNNPVHNAKVTVSGKSFYTDNNGYSPSIELQDLLNSYDADIKEWGTVTVVVEKDGFVPSVVVNCVAYSGQTRKLTVKMYCIDESELPYVCYVESPPDDYLKTLLNN